MSGKRSGKSEESVEAPGSIGPREDANGLAATLREREHQLETLLEHVPAAVAVFDREMRYLAASRRWCTDYGLGDCDIIGRSHYDIFPDLPEKWLEVHRRCMAGAVERSAAEPFPRADGRTDWVAWEVRPWHRADGEIGGLFILSEVLTRHRESELDLERTAQDLAFAVEATGVGLWEWTPDDDRVSFSREWKSQIGHEEDEISDSFDEWESRLHPEDRERVFANVQSFLADPSAHFEHSFRLRHKDGSYRQILAQGSLIRDENGNLVRVVGSHIDITERARLEAELQQAQRLESVARLAGGVAHDFNNLLTVILGTAELARMELDEGHGIAEELDEIEAAAGRAAQLTRQLLAVSSRQVVDPVVMRLDETVQALQPMLERLIGEDVKLVFESSPDALRVRADRAQMEQVIMNLVVNARDAMSDGGTLTITTRRAGRVAEPEDSDPQLRAILEVKDTGMGMDPATRQRIFEPFFTTKDPGKGTGLGLATVYGIVAQSGGEVRVDSALGAGSTFTIRLPLVEEEDAQPSAAPIEPAASHGERILLVEDERVVRRLLRRMLEASGYEVTTACDADEALCILGEGQPLDLLITDLVMPGLGGWELARQARELRPKIKVLYLSGYGGEDLDKQRKGAAKGLLLAKPVTAQELRRQVRRALES